MSRSLRLIRILTAACLLTSAAISPAGSEPAFDEALAPLTSAYMRAVKAGEQADLHRDLFGTVLRRVERSYARDVDVPKLMKPALEVLESLAPHSADPAETFRKAINAALASLDPHSRYLDARAHGNQRSALTGSFGGLGLEVETFEGVVRVVAPMPGTPAARAGLQRGDLIVRFDDQAVEGMPLSDATSRMRGQPGTPIKLTIRREGQDAEFSVTLVREIIRVQALRWSMEEDVLVLRLASFNAQTTSAVQQAIEEASASAWPRAVVLDMRGNGGGLLRQAVTTADLFLSSGEIVSLRGRTMGNQRTWQADAAEYLAGVPMVVLVDRRSASAAELVAAALQENGRATVMGQRSFGKGSVQSILPLGGERGALRLTTALYHGPSGRTVQRTGVGPDIELFAAGDTAAAGARREADRERALPGADEPPPPKARVEQSRCALAREGLDPTLACALAFLKAGEIDSFRLALETSENAPQRNAESARHSAR